MRTNKVKSLWQEGKVPTVAWLDTADTYVAETIANVGFDVLVLDMQHGMAIGPDRAALWLQAVSTTDTMPMVRVPWNEPFFIQWVLDAGAYGSSCRWLIVLRRRPKQVAPVVIHRGVSQCRC